MAGRYVVKWVGGASVCVGCRAILSSDQVSHGLGVQLFVSSLWGTVQR